MPTIVFGITSESLSNALDTSSFVGKSDLKTFFIESNIEENIEVKIQFKFKNLPDPNLDNELANKNYVDNNLSYPSIIDNHAHVDFIDKKIDNVRFVKISKLPDVREHLLPKLYVDK